MYVDSQQTQIRGGREKRPRLSTKRLLAVAPICSHPFLRRILSVLKSSLPFFRFLDELWKDSVQIQQSVQMQGYTLAVSFAKPVFDMCVNVVLKLC